MYVRLQKVPGTLLKELGVTITRRSIKNDYFCFPLNASVYPGDQGIIVLY
jgi:hypothetical protein